MMLGALALTGCSSDTEPVQESTPVATSATPTPSKTPESTPTPKTPNVPYVETRQLTAEMDAADFDGVIQLAEPTNMTKPSSTKPETTTNHNQGEGESATYLIVDPEQKNTYFQINSLTEPVVLDTVDAVLPGGTYGSQGIKASDTNFRVTEIEFTLPSIASVNPTTDLTFDWNLPNSNGDSKFKNFQGNAAAFMFNGVLTPEQVKEYFSRYVQGDQPQSISIGDNLSVGVAGKNESKYNSGNWNGPVIYKTDDQTTGNTVVIWTAFCGTNGCYTDVGAYPNNTEAFARQLRPVFEKSGLSKVELNKSGAYTVPKTTQNLVPAAK
jgi:hypothetical protein